jgi:hypothetical protein
VEHHVPNRTAVRAVEHSEIWDYETWLAPALDCMVVEKTVRWKKNHMNPDAGAYDGITTETTTSLAATAPDDSLFALQYNAVELTPSQYLTAIGQPADPKRDAAYERDKQLRTRRL